MFQIIALITSICGVLTFYLCHKNQRIFARPLPKKMKVLAYTNVILALISWQQIQSPISAVFIWLMTLMLIFIAIPLSTLFKNAGAKS